MALITRVEKGDRLTIEEMDGNLIYLNNSPLLLGKIRADLNTRPVSGNALLTSSCMSSGKPLFESGETVTFSSSKLDGGLEYGTATILSIGVSSSAACLSRDERAYLLGLTDLSFVISDLPDGAIVTGDTSGAATIISELVEDSYGAAQPIQLNPKGRLFKVNEIILTGISGEPSKSTSCWVKTSIDNTGDTVASLPSNQKLQAGGVSGLVSPTQWVAMSLGQEGQKEVGVGGDFSTGGADTSGSGYNYLVGNTLYFSADTAAGSECTVDVYVFGYTLE